MKKTWKRLFVIFAAVCLVAIVALWSMFTHGVFALTEKMVAEELDNPFINGHYQGWKNIRVFDRAEIMVPKNWEIEQEGDSLTIFENKREVAKGILVEQRDGDKSAMRSKINESRFGFPTTSAKYNELTVTNLGTGAFYYLVTASDNAGNVEEHYQMELRFSDHASCYIDFGDNKNIDTNTTLYQIEAMAFSFNSYKQ